MLIVANLCLSVALLLALTGCSSSPFDPNDLDEYFEEAILPADAEQVSRTVRWPDFKNETAVQTRLYESELSTEEICAEIRNQIPEDEDDDRDSTPCEFITDDGFATRYISVLDQEFTQLDIQIIVAHEPAE
ncbi:hypothetical protein [Euzebya tangerina]|uniref:hypothetical protein n=1 Tax=Euzebya tangerina TaxID=591198 RepID=UPI0013C2D67B|nr:hypothetical protein [Euzebya tangerina]